MLNDTYVFSGSGELSQLMNLLDWSKTPIGEPTHWPESLKSALGICLNCQYPMAIYWGHEGYLFYNDAWRPIVGDKHPWALGRPAKEVWPEIWDLVGPVFENVFQTKKGSFQPNSLLPMKRYGYTEECYFDYTFSPIIGSQSNVEGILNVVTETTYRVLNERRTKLLREIADRATSGKSVKEACKFIFEAIGSDPEDIPFALLYLTQQEKKQAYLYGVTGFKKDTKMAPETIDFTSSDSSTEWPLSQVIHEKKIIEVKDLLARFESLLVGSAWPEAIHTAVVLPLEKRENTHPNGFLIVGISPRRVLDTAYHAFHDFLASAIETAISHARDYEEEKNRAEKLAEIDRVKTVFFSNISHEFRTPLTLMLSPLEDALSDKIEPLPAQQHTRIALIQRNGLRLLKLVNSLLDFSRIEANRVQAIYEPIDISQLTIDLAGVFRSLVEKAGLQLIVNAPPIDEMVYVDREMYEKIIFNLLSNAFKFTLKGSIQVFLKKEENHVEISVQDTGVGIPATELPRLFERFYRVEGTHHGRSYEGTGIGLALVQELVKLQYGTIQVKSQLGQGSEFIVKLPLGKAHLSTEKLGDKREIYQPGLLGKVYVEEATRWVSNTSSSTTNSNVLPVPIKARILLADDNADMRQYVKSLLEEKWSVEAVENGEEALKIALANPPDLVLSDIMMPKLDGFGLLKELRQNSNTAIIPIILLSARAGEEAKIEGLQAGADDYIVKPFSSKELLVRVEAHLKIMQIRKAAFKREQELLTATQIAQNNLTQVITHLNDGFYTFNREWQCTYINQQCAELARKPKEAILGKVFWDVFPDLKGTSLEHDFRMAMETGNAKKIEFYYPAYKEWYEHHIYPNEGGISGLVHNITLRKQLETESYLSKQTEFMDTLCHELRNPLNGIYGSVSVLEEHLRTLTQYWMKIQSSSDKSTVEAVNRLLQELQENTKAITQCSQQQKVIVDDVLNLSKLESNKVELNPISFNLKQVLTNVTDMFTSQIQQKKLKVITELAEDVWLKADLYRLSQILGNLISNAIKFTESGSIHIKASVDQVAGQTDTVLCISVEDTGIGMTEAEIKNLFKRFSQANSRTSSQYGGSGLGLLICKKLVELMGGTIQVTSQKNKKTSFIFTICCSVLTAAEKQQAQQEKELSQISPDVPIQLIAKKILVVEDNVVNQKIIMNYLKPQGIDCEIANNGLEALEKYQQTEFDLIFMDIEMPKMNGLEATREIRKKEKILNPHIPIIGLSGNVRKEQVQIALDAGMNDYLTKPYHRQDVYKMVKKYSQPQSFGLISTTMGVSNHNIQNNVDKKESSTQLLANSIQTIWSCCKPITVASTIAAASAVAVSLYFSYNK